MATPPETSFSLLLPDLEPPFPDGVKEVLADLTFYCATFKMGIPFVPDRLNPLSSLRPCGGPAPRHPQRLRPGSPGPCAVSLPTFGLATSCTSKREYLPP